MSYYTDYLQSENWQRKREYVLARCGGMCELCIRRGASRDAAHVHHRTYVRLGREYPSDLLGLCAECHRRIHRLTELPSGGYAWAELAAELLPTHHQRKKVGNWVVLRASDVPKRFPEFSEGRFNDRSE